MTTSIRYGLRAYAHLPAHTSLVFASLASLSARSEASADSIRRLSRALESSFIFPALPPYIHPFFTSHLPHPPFSAPRVCGLLGCHCAFPLLSRSARVWFRQLRTRVSSIMSSSFVNCTPTLVRGYPPVRSRPHTRFTQSLRRGAKAHSMCALSTVV